MADVDSTRKDSWLPVPGYSGLYEVSDLGEVRSVDREIIYKDGRRGFWRGRTLRQTPTDRGYLMVWLSRHGKQQIIAVHRLVIETHVLGGSPIPDGMHACHQNGDKSDNRASNLRVDTPSGNVLDQVKHGTHWHAAKTHCPQGHSYDEQNTSWNGGSRKCRECRGAGRRNTADGLTQSTYLGGGGLDPS